MNPSPTATRNPAARHHDTSRSSSRSAGAPYRCSSHARLAAPTTKFVPRRTPARQRRSGRLVAVDRRAGGEVLAEDRLDRTVIEHLELARLHVEAGTRLRV